MLVNIEQLNSAFESAVDNVLNAVAESGYAIIEQAIPLALINDLLLDCQHQQDQFVAAGIGRQQAQQLNSQIRKDKTLWFNGKGHAQQQYLELMGNIQQAVNRHFYLGLVDYECHYATYQQGDFYQKHLDAFKGRSNRVLTTVCYLNTPASGGELVIYDQTSPKPLAHVAPKAGTLVIFESERFPHEVLAAQSLRHSIAGWFRTNNSLAGMIDPAQ